uniref:GRF-type domain-containing protein n=1 Tax=Oryza glaberrima TaxID=4538 RepID=I1QIZ8_ORYGL
MDGGYTASASSRRMGKPALPLIQCPQCELKTIVWRKAKTSENYGRIFYTCPSHQRDGTGCDFWYWEEYYEQYLIKGGYLQACSGSRGKRQVIDLHGEGEGEGEGVGGRQVAEQIEDKQLLTESQKNELTESHHNSEITTGDRTYITR